MTATAWAANDVVASPVVNGPARRRVRMVAVIVAGAVSLWLLRSSLGSVYGDLGDVAAVDARWLLAIVGCEVVAFVAAWELSRLALRTDRWFDVAVAQLSGNAASNVVPAGGAVGAAVQLRVLAEAGFEMTRAATSLGALSVLGSAGLLAVPVLALPMAATGSSDPRLETALWIGVTLLVAGLIGVVALVAHDRPLAGLAEAIQWARNRIRPGPVRSDLPARVLAERDAIAAAVRERPGLVLAATVGRTLADVAALYVALLAAGARPSPAVVLVGFGAATVAGMIPITPGGLGFVEAGITGTLVAAGIDPVAAALAAALYRLANTWLPALAGLVGYAWFRRRHHVAPVPTSGVGGVAGGRP